MSSELRDNLIKTRQQLLARSQTWRDDFTQCPQKICNQTRRQREPQGYASSIPAYPEEGQSASSLRINDLRRLPKVKSPKNDVPASMEVEFVTGGEKKSFFRAITALQKSHKTLGVRISNKFPEYSMRANKHLPRADIGGQATAGRLAGAHEATKRTGR